jgi:hypothetical protein
MLCGIDNIMQNIPHIHTECGEYSTKYCQSHITLLWIRIMLWAPHLFTITFLVTQHAHIR